MTIEFNCPHCDKLLKTSDDKAGRQAKCPGCGELIDVPNAGKLPEPKLLDAEEVDESELEEADVDDEPSDEMKFCPMCGETIRAAAVRCRFCGEVLDKSGLSRKRSRRRREMRPFPPGEVINESWRIFVDKLGFSVGSFLVVLLLSFVCMGIVFGMMTFAGALADQKNDAAAAVVMVVAIVLYIATAIFLIHVQIGYQIIQLKLAREQPAELGDLFTGGRFLGRMILSSIVFGFMYLLGFVACIVPGIIVMLMFFPYVLVLIDEDSPGIQCLWRAKELTDGNWGSIILVFLVSMGASIAGSMACYVGLLISIPFINLLFAMEYDRMSCQTPLNQIPGANEA